MLIHTCNYIKAFIYMYTYSEELKESRVKVYLFISFNDVGKRLEGSKIRRVEIVMKIGQNTEKCQGDLRRLTLIQG